MPAPRFTLESREPLGIVCKLVGQDLDRYLPGEVRVLGTIDFAHAALAELFGDPLMGECLAYHGEFLY